MLVIDISAQVDAGPRLKGLESTTPAGDAPPGCKCGGAPNFGEIGRFWAAEVLPELLKAAAVRQAATRPGPGILLAGSNDALTSAI